MTGGGLSLGESASRGGLHPGGGSASTGWVCIWGVSASTGVGQTKAIGVKKKSNRNVKLNVVSPCFRCVSAERVTSSWDRDSAIRYC